ncbi:MAG: hypothetical protein WBL65_20560 [Bryobacteraceae bacterium]
MHDAAGRAAKLLSAVNRAGIDPGRVIWVDLAGRRRPVPVFRIRRSAHLRGIWASVLKSIRNVAKAVIGDGTIEWAAEAAYALSADGSVGLGALLRCLSSTETRRWFLETRNHPADLAKLLDMLAWALSFPAVYAILEGGNRGDFLNALDKSPVLWLESPAEHFEPKEHLLLPHVAEWVQHSEVIWVVGPAGPLSEKAHGKWLSPTEAGRVSALAKGDPRFGPRSRQPGLRPH